MAMPSLLAAETLSLPSGLEVTPLEYLDDTDETGPVLRARYHAPALSGGEDAEVVFADMTHLCEQDALNLRGSMTDKPDRVIVSLSSKPIAFGEIDAEVTQYFEAFAVETGRCIWELF